MILQFHSNTIQCTSSGKARQGGGFYLRHNRRDLYSFLLLTCNAALLARGFVVVGGEHNVDYGSTNSVLLLDVLYCVALRVYVYSISNSDWRQ